MLKALARRLDLSEDAEEAADLETLYTSIVSTGRVLSCIAASFCEHIASPAALCTVNLATVRKSLLDDPQCFKLEDAFPGLIAGNALSAAAVEGSWQAFLDACILLQEEVTMPIIAFSVLFVVHLLFWALLSILHGCTWYVMVN